MGKTAQAIGVIGRYASELPALIVVPASVKVRGWMKGGTFDSDRPPSTDQRFIPTTTHKFKFSWAAELEKWTTLPAAHIKLIRSRSDVGRRGADLVILTYGMLSGQAPVVKAVQRARFRIVVLDESHAIKSAKSQRYQLLAPILRSAQRLVLLSGTPALARPVELYTQVRPASVDRCACHFWVWLEGWFILKSWLHGIIIAALSNSSHEHTHTIRQPPSPPFPPPV